jgi:chitodextrinase
VGTTLADTVAPTVPGIPYVPSGYLTYTTAYLNWAPSTDNVAVVTYDIYRNAVKISSSTSATYSDSGLAAGTTYSYTILAKDATGNASAQSGAGVVITPSDTVAPLPPTYLVLSARTDSSLTLYWYGASDPTGTIVGYDMLVAGGSTTFVNTTSGTISGLLPATPYTITVKSVDSGGNRSVASLPLVVQTTIDEIPPTDPGTPTLVTSTGSSITITWTSSTDNRAVLGYDIRRSSTSTVTVGRVTNGLTFTDTDLPGSTRYNYSVRAFDAAGNHSSWSLGLDFTTELALRAEVLASSVLETETTGTSFRFVRTGSTSLAATVTVTWGGNAVSGVDYTGTLPASVVIPAGQSSVDVPIVPRENLLSAADHNITASVSDNGFVSFKNLIIRNQPRDRSLLTKVTAFDAVQWTNSAAYRTAYLAGISPSRIWQTADGASNRPPLQAVGSSHLTVADNGTVSISVQGLASMPISFALTGPGVFTQNGANAITVLANSSGVATVTYSASGGGGRIPILAGSPFAVGQARIVVEILP